MQAPEDVTCKQALPYRLSFPTPPPSSRGLAAEDGEVKELTLNLCRYHRCHIHPHCKNWGQLQKKKNSWHELESYPSFSYRHLLITFSQISEPQHNQHNWNTCGSKQYLPNSLTILLEVLGSALRRRTLCLRRLWGRELRAEGVFFHV